MKYLLTTTALLLTHLVNKGLTSPTETPGPALSINKYVSGNVSTSILLSLPDFQLDRSGFVKLGKDGVFRSYKASETAWEVIDWRALDPTQIGEMLAQYSDRTDNFTAWKGSWDGVDGRDVVAIEQLQRADDDLDPPREPPVSRIRRSPLEDSPDANQKSCKDFYCIDASDCSPTFTGTIPCDECDRTLASGPGCVYIAQTCFLGPSGAIYCV